MSPCWSATTALDALLDALEADLLGTSPEEVQAALREIGRARESAVHELRSLLRDATTQGHDRYTPAPSSDECDVMDARRH